RLGTGPATGPVVLTGETLDVSTGGCRVTTDRPWPGDHDPFLSIDLPDGEPVRAQARVVTVDLTGGGWEYRLSFADLAEPDRDRPVLARGVRRPGGVDHRAGDLQRRVRQGQCPRPGQLLRGGPPWAHPHRPRHRVPEAPVPPPHTQSHRAVVSGLLGAQRRIRP